MSGKSIYVVIDFMLHDGCRDVNRPVNSIVYVNKNITSFIGDAHTFKVVKRTSIANILQYKAYFVQVH